MWKLVVNQKHQIDHTMLHHDPNRSCKIKTGAAPPQKKYKHILVPLVLLQLMLVLMSKTKKQKNLFAFGFFLFLYFLVFCFFFSFAFFLFFSFSFFYVAFPGAMGQPFDNVFAAPSENQQNYNHHKLLKNVYEVLLQQI